MPYAQVTGSPATWTLAFRTPGPRHTVLWLTSTTPSAGLRAGPILVRRTGSAPCQTGLCWIEHGLHYMLSTDHASQAPALTPGQQRRHLVTLAARLKTGP